MKNFLFPLIASHTDGRTILMYTVADVFGFAHKYGRWTDHHVTHYYDFAYGFHRRVESNGWIVRDDRGRNVRWEDLPTNGTRRYSRYRSDRLKEIRHAADKGLPIPGTGGYRKCWKMNHTAKKNSGAGHRNRNRALAEYERVQYGIKNPYGPVRPWEGY